MQLLAAADFHGDLRIFKWLLHCVREHSPDAVILAGDLLAADPDHPGPIEDAHRECASTVVEILSTIDVPVLYIMGNDDMVDLEPPTGSIRSIHGSRTELHEFNFVGYQFSLPFMGGINEKPEADIRSDLERLEPLIDERTVFVTHSPAFGILDIGILDRHAGSDSIGDVIDRRNPIAHIHGHIHSQFGRSGKHFNVAAAGTGSLTMIELPKLTHRVLERSGR
jgi:Icc-related predicted phosphoesterase